MISEMSCKVADFFVRKKVVSEQEKDIYVYGCEAIFSGLVNSLIVFFTGIFFKDFLCVFTFYIVFLMLRKYCGGYHAKTHFRCHFVFLVNLLLIMLMIKKLPLLNISYSIPVIILSDVLIVLLAPVQNENKPIESRKARQFKAIAVIFSLVFSILSVILYFVRKDISEVIILSMLSVSLAMVVTKKK